MDTEFCSDIFENHEKYEKCAKEIDESYSEIYKIIKGRNPDNFSEAAMIMTLAKFKTEQVACLIGQGLSDHDKKVLSGVIERHIAGVLYKG